MEQAKESFHQNPFQLRFIVGALLAVVVFVLLMGSWFTIEQYESGVVTTWGKISYVASPGLGIKVPLVQSITHIRTDIQSLTPKEKVNTYTSDNQEIDILFTVFYRLPPEKVAFVYTNAQDYYARLYNIANDRVKAEMGKVKLEHFAEHRGEIRDRIRSTLVKDADVLGLEVTDFQFTDVDYTKLFRDAVNAASVQKANVETREGRGRGQCRKGSGRRRRLRKSHSGKGSSRSIAHPERGSRAKQGCAGVASHRGREDQGGEVGRSLAGQHVRERPATAAANLRLGTQSQMTQKRDERIATRRNNS